MIGLPCLSHSIRACVYVNSESPNTFAVLKVFGYLTGSRKGFVPSFFHFFINLDRAIKSSPQFLFGTYIDLPENHHHLEFVQLTIFVLKVIMMVVHHVLLVERLSNLIFIIFSLPVAITGTIPHLLYINIIKQII